MNICAEDKVLVPSSQDGVQVQVCRTADACYDTMRLVEDDDSMVPPVAYYIVFGQCNFKG
jgi:hypothetical protein